MKSHTSLVAQQTRLNEWADLIRDCQNRPQGMKIDEWCQLHDITKASYYWRLRKVREAYLETAEHTQAFVEVPSSALQYLLFCHRTKIQGKDTEEKNHKKAKNGVKIVWNSRNKGFKFRVKSTCIFKVTTDSSSPT